MKIYKVDVTYPDGQEVNLIERGNTVIHVFDTVVNEHSQDAVSINIQELTGEEEREYRIEWYEMRMRKLENFACIGRDGLVFELADHHDCGLVGFVSSGGYNRAVTVFPECFNCSEHMFAFNVYSLTFIEEIQEAFKRSRR